MAEIMYKNLGETSFQAIERFRSEHPKYKDERLSFAGRLDPMAEGYMLILVGDDNDNREEFLGLDKEYESEFLFGIATDTFDVMGLIQNISDEKPDGSKVTELLEKTVGKQMQKFPPFSKRHVKGKAMFVWATEGRLDEIEIPEHEIEIYSLDILEFGTRKVSNVANDAIDRVSNVTGDFRQEKIIAGWQEYTNDDREFMTVKVRISCGTGTYIRQIAEDIGKELGVGGITLSINRTKIGDLV